MMLKETHPPSPVGPPVPGGIGTRHRTRTTPADSRAAPAKTTRLRFLPALLLACLLAAPAPAQTPANAPLLERLGHPDYAQREAATSELLLDPHPDSEALRELFLAAPLPEQRWRLLNVIQHHTLTQLRETLFPPDGDPAIGFSHDIRRQARLLPDGREASVVYVVSTLPGFPGFAHLRTGDLIIEVDDQPLPPDLDNALFRQRLQTREVDGQATGREAGEPIALTVIRGTQTLRVELTLATVDALERMYTQSPTLQEPFHSRWNQARDELLAAAPPVDQLHVPPAP